MAREISVHEVPLDLLRAELRYVVRYLRDLGHEHCELEFGWRWGMDYPPEAPWATMHVPLAEVENEIRKPEEIDLGRFGYDDIIMRVPALDSQFLFCHHGGIHLTCSRPGQIANEFLAHWASRGFAPVERESTSSQ